MTNNTYTILGRRYTGALVKSDDNTLRKMAVYEVFADNMSGFEDFVNQHGLTALPGSTVDIADNKAAVRLRHDGQWEDYTHDAAYITELHAWEGGSY